jgi:hypothetical protein
MEVSKANTAHNFFRHQAGVELELPGMVPV